jgi:hypothetical protein
MNVRDRLIEMLDKLDRQAVLRLYDIALDYQKTGKPLARKEIRRGFRRSQHALQGIKDSLADDVAAMREERF